MAFMELSLKLKGFPVNEALNEIRTLRALSPKDFAAWQEKRKWEMVRYHFENNEFYRNRLNGAIPESWGELPVLQKADYQQTAYDIISKTIDRKDLYTGYTSGSSGHPFKYAKDKFAHAVTWAVIKLGYQSYGIDLDSKQARFYGIPLEKKDYLIERTKDSLANRYRFPVFDLSDKAFDGFTEKFRTTEFDYVYGYTNSIVMYARYLIRKNILLKDICPTVKLCICTSENCAEEDKEIIERAFGVKAVNEYGTSEVDLIAFEDFSGKWRLSHEVVYIEALDESGKPVEGEGEARLVLTSLYNKAMPFIRYEIGDRALVEVVSGDIQIKRLLGGVNDIVRLPSGRESSGISFYFITRKILERGGSLKEFIIRQTAIDKFVIEVVADEPVTDEQKKQIQKNMDMYLEPGLSFEIKMVERIERTKAGKMKHFFSDLN